MKQLDPRTKEDLLEEIRKRAPYFTPEWRFNLDKPDAGTALAMIWADMHAETIERLNNLAENARLALLEVSGVESRPALPARGYLSFELQSGGDVVLVPGGTGVRAPDEPDCVLLTDRDLEVSHTEIISAYYVNPRRDICCELEQIYDIQLFGESEVSGHVWEFMHPFAFDLRAGAELKLRFKLNTGLEILSGEDVSWQYSSGEMRCEFAEVSYRDGFLYLKFPLDKERHCCGISMEIRNGVIFSGVKLAGLEVYPEERQLKPAALYSGDEELSAEGLYPFNQRFSLYNCFYIACPELLAKAGAKAELSFFMRFEQFEIEGYQAAEINWRFIMKQSDIRIPEDAVIRISNVAWEYFNGTGWASLPVSDRNSRFVFGGDSSELSRYIVGFVCPTDIQPYICGAHDTLFIRARILNVENLFSTKGHYVTPYIENPRFSYKYERSIELDCALLIENLQTRAVDFKAEREVDIVGRIAEQSAVYFAFGQAFRTGALLFKMKSQIEAKKLEWEYLAEIGWSSLDVNDASENLGKTGLVSFSAPHDCKCANMFSREAYWMRIIDRSGGYDNPKQPKPHIEAIYPNTVPATAREPGSKSNLGAGAYNSLLIPLNGINKVTNPLSVNGGCDTGDDDETAVMGIASFAHRNRAVSRKDFERITLEASTKVLRCKCVASADMDGRFSRGDICIVVQCKGNAEGEDFSELRDAITDYIKNRMPAAFKVGGELYVIEPHYTAVNLSIDAGILNSDAVLMIKTRIAKEVSKFVDSVTGGFDGKGWQIGSLPSPSQLAALLRDVQGIAYVQKLSVKYIRKTRNGEVTDDYRTASRDRLVSPINGKHDIVLRSAL